MKSKAPILIAIAMLWLGISYTSPVKAITGDSDLQYSYGDDWLNVSANTQKYSFWEGTWGYCDVWDYDYDYELTYCSLALYNTLYPNVTSNLYDVFGSPFQQYDSHHWNNYGQSSYVTLDLNETSPPQFGQWMLRTDHGWDDEGAVATCYNAFYCVLYILYDLPTIFLSSQERTANADQQCGANSMDDAAKYWYLTLFNVPRSYERGVDLDCRSGSLVLEADTLRDSINAEYSGPWWNYFANDQCAIIVNVVNRVAARLHTHPYFGTWGDLFNGPGCQGDKDYFQDNYNATGPDPNSAASPLPSINNEKGDHLSSNDLQVGQTYHSMNYMWQPRPTSLGVMPIHAGYTDSIFTPATDRTVNW